MSVAAGVKISAGEVSSPAERFVDWELIGSGGAADVFKVRDKELGVLLAIKILKQLHREDRRYIDSLRSEVLISRKLRHPNICPIHDLYEGPQGIGIVMDLIEGQDLKGWMQAHRGRLLETIAPRLTVLRKLTEALAVAHSQITHRDLKPANIFIKNNDISSPIIMDFGLSASTGEAGSHGLTGGTPKYMAPEQLLAPQTVDRRADLFALGVLAYELLTDGEIPACSLKETARIGELPRFQPEDILPPSAFCAALPKELDRLILHMLDHDRDKRPQSADEVKAVLDSITLRNPFELSRGRDVKAEAAATVPAGTYTVGERSAGARACDSPQRRIGLGAYRIAIAPVTNAQYRAFVKATGYRAPALINHARFGKDTLPVVMVSWDDAIAYAQWAGGRLPTECEWEVAARAGEQKNHYPWGDEPPRNTQANIDGVCVGPTPVGSYATGTNAWGLTDCCGNVWEWCIDPWDEHHWKNIGSDAASPVAQVATELRAIRGGSYDSLAVCGHCSFRHRAGRTTMRADLGFRLAYNS
jgi:formylglycine-generating enzyme required for sulfatase activity/tRNA A-37 threonylcarbamoyl transferase component Bud32